MTPTEFVSGLAEVMDVPTTELSTVDRALAKKGLRRLARGRSRPDIDLMEGIQIACAWAGAKKLTDAAREIERQRKCIISRDHKADELGVVYEFDTEHQEAFGASLRDLTGKNFLDVVALAAGQVGKNRYSAQDLWISIEKEDRVRIFYKTRRGKVEESFDDLSDRPVLRSRKVKVIVEIEGSILKWIYDVTEGA